MTTFESKIERFIFRKNFKKFHVEVFDTFNSKEVVSFYNMTIGKNLTLTAIVEIHLEDLTINPVSFHLHLSDSTLLDENDTILENKLDKTIIKYARYSCEDFDEFVEKFEKEHNQIIESI